MTLTDLGNVWRNIGDRREARSNLERALRIKRDALDPTDPDLAITLANLGGLLDEIGDRAGAREYLQQALGVFEAAYGVDDRRTTAIRDAIGGLI